MDYLFRNVKEQELKAAMFDFMRRPTKDAYKVLDVFDQLFHRIEELEDHIDRLECTEEPVDEEKMYEIADES